jgi:hypothetical protein
MVCPLVAFVVEAVKLQIGFESGVIDLITLFPWSTT